jgi:hypothetical protein
MTTHLRFGDEEFWLDAGDAAEVQRLCATDRQAGLSLARRQAHRASITVPMMLMDAAPPAPVRPLRDAAPSPSPVHPPRTTPMTPMTKIRVGDREHYVDAAVAREIETLRGANTALSAIAAGNLQPVAAHSPAGQPVVDAFTASKIAARDALRAQEARNNDPATPQGAYREYLRNAHRGDR